MPRLPARSSARSALLFALFAAGAGVLLVYGAAWSPGELVLAACGYLAAWAAVARTAVRKLFGPVFLYELTRLGRRRGTFLTRFLYILVVTGGLGYWYSLWTWSVQASAGRDVVRAGELANFATQFFAVYAVAQYAVVAVLTPVYVAGCIADEKERKTLEFLLATDLTGYEIVFGKAAARVLTLLMFVLAGLPVLAFLQLFGGIDPDLLLANTAAAVVTILGLTALSLFCSVRHRRPREAIAAAYVTAAAYLGATTAGMMYVWHGLPHDVFDPFTVLGYTVTHLDVLTAATRAAEWAGAGNLLATASGSARALAGGASAAGVINDVLTRYGVFMGALFALLMLYAVLRLRAVTLKQTYGAPRRLKERVARRRPPVGSDGVAWKEVFVDGAVRTKAGVAFTVLLLVLVFSGPAVMLVVQFGQDVPVLRDHLYPTGREFPQRLAEFRSVLNGYARVVTAVLGVLALLGVAIRGAGAVSGERDRDTWVSLISTPVSAWEVAWAKWLGAVLGLRRTYAILACLWALVLAAGAAEPAMVVAMAATFAVYVSAFGWLGVFCSISAKSTLVATVRALLAGAVGVGGFWVLVGCLCALPLNLLAGANSQAHRVADEGAALLYGVTPPLVLGFLPVETFDRPEPGPFSRRVSVLGPVSPVSGVFAWLAVTWALGAASWRGISRLANRKG